MSGPVAILMGTGGFKGSTTQYNTAGSFTETIPQGALHLTIESTGASAGGGNGVNIAGNGAGGGGGAGGAYCLTVLNISPTNWNQTINVVVGTGGAVTTNGTASVVSSGTFSLTIMTANGGFAGNNAASQFFVGNGGSGQAATGGNTINTIGNSGGAGQLSGQGITRGPGGAGIAGINITGRSGGQGGSANAGSTTPSPGGDGIVFFSYT